MIARIWQRIPVVVRAVAVGTAMLMIGEGVPSNLFLLNRKWWPAVPWFAPVAVLWLWVFWQYAGGRWWPQSTSAARQENLRARQLTPHQWRWALIAGGATLMSSAALHFAAARFDPIDYRGFFALFALPPQTVASLIFVISAAAGIVEEAAYRGTMQGMIERRHGTVVAIIIVALFFTLVHIGSIPPLTPTRTFFIVVASVTYSVLTLLTGSILPGIVLHATGDAAGVFLLWFLWARDGLGTNAPPWIYLAESAILAVIAAYAFRRLYAYRSAAMIRRGE